MKKTIVVVFVFMLMQVWADQLVMNTEENCKEAVKLLKPGTRVALFCSKCDNEKVKVYEIIESKMIKVKKFYEVSLKVKELLVSEKEFSNGKGLDNLTFKKSEKGIMDIPNRFGSIDLAYTYIETSPSLFICIGKVLKLECHVNTESFFIND